MIMTSGIRKPNKPLRWMKPVKNKGKAKSKSKSKSKRKSNEEDVWFALFPPTMIPWPSASQMEPLPGRDADGFWILERKGGGTSGV